jgi:hypothetical protein
MNDSDFMFNGKLGDYPALAQCALAFCENGPMIFLTTTTSNTVTR